MAKVGLGQRVRDRISGLEGVVIARTEWLYGCARITVQPQDTKDGKPAETYTLDEPQIEILGDDFVPDAVAARAAAPEQGRHGDRPDAQRAPDPTR